MTKLEKILLVALLLYLVGQKNQQLSNFIGTATQDFWESQAAFTIF